MGQCWKADGITLFVIKRRVWVTTDTRDGQAERLLNTTIL